MSAMDGLGETDRERLAMIGAGSVEYYVRARQTRDPRTRRVRVDAVVIRCRIRGTGKDVTADVARLVVAGYVVNPGDDLATIAPFGLIELTETGRAVVDAGRAMAGTVRCELCEIEHDPVMLLDIMLETMPLPGCRKCVDYLRVVGADFYVF